MLEALLTQDFETALETLPEIAVQRTINFAKRFFVRGVDGDVELCNGLKGGELIWVLCVADEEGGNMLFMEHSCEFIDVRVEYGLAYKTECAMSYSHCFGKSLRSYTGYSSHHFDLLVVACFHAVEDHLWWIDLPSPCCSNRVGAVSPAKYAFVGAG